MSPGTVEGRGSTRVKRGRPRGSGRGSRATGLGEEPPRTRGESLDLEAARFPRPLLKKGSAVERGKKGAEREEGQRKGTWCNFALLLQTTRVVRPAGAVKQQLPGDTEWWGCPVAVNMQCMRGAW